MRSIAAELDAASGRRPSSARRRSPGSRKGQEPTIVGMARPAWHPPPDDRARRWASAALGPGWRVILGPTPRGRHRDGGRRALARGSEAAPAARSSCGVGSGRAGRPRTRPSRRRTRPACSGVSREPACRCRSCWRSTRTAAAAARPRCWPTVFRAAVPTRGGAEARASCAASARRSRRSTPVDGCARWPRPVRTVLRPRAGADARARDPSRHLGARARELTGVGPRHGPDVFLHRDFHPGNTLWSGCASSRGSSTGPRPRADPPARTSGTCAPTSGRPRDRRSPTGRSPPTRPRPAPSRRTRRGGTCGC